MCVATLLLLLGGRLMLGALERQLIYFPARVRSEAATPVIPGARGVEEVWLEAEDGVRVHGLYAMAGRPFADLLFFHGNAGSLYDRLHNVGLLLDLGFNVLIIDYRGYGKSEGTPSEVGLYEDGALALRHLLEDRGVEPARLVLFGRSLGSTVAVELALERQVGAVILESAFTSARELGRVHYGWLPKVVFESMTHRFDSLEKVPRLRTPALFVHGSADAIVPVEMGRRLFEASPEPKEWYVIEGAGHNDTVAVGGEEYLQRLREFARKNVVDRSD